MNDVSLHVPYIFDKKQNSKHTTHREKIQKAQLKAEKLGTKRGLHKTLTDQREREREAKLTHSNLQRSKSLSSIIRSCNLYE